MSNGAWQTPHRDLKGCCGLRFFQVNVLESPRSLMSRYLMAPHGPLQLVLRAAAALDQGRGLYPFWIPNDKVWSKSCSLLDDLHTCSVRCDGCSETVELFLSCNGTLTSVELFVDQVRAALLLLSPEIEPCSPSLSSCRYVGRVRRVSRVCVS